MYYGRNDFVDTARQQIIQPHTGNTENRITNMFREDATKMLLTQGGVMRSNQDQQLEEDVSWLM